MNSTHNGSVAAFFTNFRNCCKEIRFINFRKNFFSKIFRNHLYFAGNSSIFIRKIRMACPCINNAKCVSAGRKIKIHRFDDWFFFIKKVDRNKVSDGGSSLIHKSAGFSKENIFCILTDLCNFCLRNFRIKKHMIYNGSDEDFISGRRRKPTSGKNGGFTVCVKAFNFASKLYKACCNSSYKCGGSVYFIIIRNKIINIYFAHRITF